jgi:UDP-glucose 4-epimerase
MKIIVTGGAGFIGSHLVEALISGGHRVLVLDNLSTGRMKNLSHIKSARLSFQRVDVSDESQPLYKYFTGIDWVFHLAALADIVPSIVQPLKYHQANVTGTVNVLEASRKACVKRFLYAASSSCYGIPDKYPTDETAPVRPQYPYALTKYAGEQYVLHWGQVYKLPVVSLRLFNVFGPRSRTSGTYGAVFGTFLAQKLAGVPLTVVGDGTQSRDFTYVSDVVCAFILAAKSNVTGQVFNVGSGKSHQVNELVKLIGGKIVYIPKRPGEPDRTEADIKKIKKVLGWVPQVNFSDGVKILLQNIDYWKDAPVWTPGKINKATKEWFTYLR